MFALAGCLSVPPPASNDDAGGPGTDAPVVDARINDATDASSMPMLSPLVDSRTGSTLTIGNAIARMRLQSTGTHSPVELVSPGGSNQNLLYEGAATLERYAGVELWPAWFTYMAGEDLSFTEDAIGPAVMQITTVVRMSGMTVTTTHTMHPDGRIHRWERVTFDSVNEGWFVAYVSLDCALIDGVTWSFANGDTGSATLDPRNCLDDTQFREAQGAHSLGYVCAHSSTGRDVIGWAHHMHGPTSRYPEYLRLSRTIESVSLTSDWIQGEFPQIATYTGHFLTVVNNLDNSTGANCSMVAAHTGGFQNPPAISVTAPASSVTTGPGDDDADGYNEGGGYYQVSASGGTAELSISGGTAAPTTTFLVDNFDATSSPVVELGGVALQHGYDYLYQATSGGGGMWLHLARPLGADTLVVTEGS